jgi:hypothetical protein
MRKLILVLIAGICFTASASAQRQTKLYIDDGNGNFSILSAAPGGGALTLPGSTLAFPSANAIGVLTNDGAGSLSWGASSGFTPAYLNVYYASIGMFVPSGSLIPLTTTAIASGFLVSSDGTTETVTSAGIYKIDFSIPTPGPSHVSIAVNGTVLSNGVFFSLFTATEIHGSAIVSLSAGDLIQLINEAGGNLNLVTSIGGSQSATLTAVRIE